VLDEIYRRIRSINENKLEYKYRSDLAQMIPALWDRFKQYEYTANPMHFLTLEGDLEKLIEDIKENYERMQGFDQLAIT